MVRSIALALILLPGLANALGIGKLELQSGLNEPFDARIDILSPTVDDIESLKVNLASSEAYARAGIDLSIELTKLRFSIVQVESGNDYIRVYSTDAIREPFLNFLLEVNWARGRLLREYTVLLDPPTYAPDLKFQPTIETQTELRPVPAPQSSAAVSAEPNSVLQQGDHSVVYNPEYTPSASPSRAAPAQSFNYSGGDYTTRAGDTLWSVASSMRPDSSVSVQQMMMALYRANPEAFMGNINGLKRGQILTAPELDEINTLSKSSAVDAVREQNSLWSDVKTSIAEAPTTRPESAGVADSMTATSTAIADVSTADPELRLVGAGSDDNSSGQGDSAAGAAAANAAAELAVAEESLITLESENRELQDKLVEAESIIGDLKSLIALKEDELNALKEQIRASESASEAEAIDAVEEAIEVVEEEVAEEVIEEVEEEIAEQPYEEVEEEVAEEELEAIEEEVAEEVEEVEEEVEEVIEETTDATSAPVSEAQAPAQAGSSPMDMVNQYLGPIKDIIMQNLMIVGGALGAVVLLILGLFGYKKIQSNKAETVDFGEADIMDFENMDDTPDDAGLMDIDDAEAPTELPDDEDDVDITPTPQAPEEDEDTTQIASFEESPEPEAEEPEEDPLAEVNVFLAYEHFDQAADFVKSALEDQPDNLDFHTKLLEVYYAANDKSAYEEAAKVLHDKVNGEGDHWNMAVAMWSEMSPGRGLFEEREDGLDDTQEMPKEAADSVIGGGGIVDLTADADADAGEDKGAGTDAGLDFDIGEETNDAMLDLTAGEGEEQAMDSTISEASADEEEVLDITSNDDEEDVLDLTAAEDVSSADDEDLLDVTSAVGLDMDAGDTTGEMEIPDVADDADDMLDLTGGSDDEDLLDVSSSGASDLLEASSTGAEDLLDVTAATNLDADADENLLDVTTASTSASTGSDLLEDGDTDALSEDLAETSLDFDVEGLDLDIDSEQDAAASTDSDSVIEKAMDSDSDDNVLEFELNVDDADSSATDTPAVDDLEIDLDIETDSPATEDDADDLSIDLSAMEETSTDVSDDLEIDLDMTSSDADESPEIDLTEASATGGVELDLTSDLNLEEENTDSISDDDFSLDLEIQDEPDAAPEADSPSDSGVPEIDMEGTVEIPKMDFNVGDEDEEDDDDEQKTVFVPRTSDSDEQSLEDEISTKLDLAKAYVELGDNESAKTILDEIIAEGNESQKQQAQDLLNQVS